jgi:hypothetical protein
MILISAYSTKAAVIDNLIAIATWWTSLMFRDGHFEKVRLYLHLHLSPFSLHDFLRIGKWTC